MQVGEDQNLTIKGKSIFRKRADSQNWLRRAISALNVELHERAWDSDDSGATPISTVLSALAMACMDRRHITPRSAGMTTYSGKPLLTDPTFTWFDLWSYGTSSIGGTPAFCSAIGLPTETGDQQLLIAAGLFLLDDAIDALDANRESYAGYLVHMSGKCLHEVDLRSLEALPSNNVKKAIADLLSERGRTAGKKSGDARRRNALRTEDVQREADRLLADGKEERNINSLLANRFQVSAQHIRNLRKKAN